MGKRKGQVATEFFTYSAIFLLLVIVVIFSVFSTQDGENRYYLNQNLIESGNAFSSAFNLASFAGPGFNYTFEFPKYVYGIEYNISFVQNRWVSIEWYNYMDMIFIYPINKIEIERSSVQGNCIEKLGEAYVIKSTKGENKLNIYNDGKKIIILQGGC